MSGFAGLGLSGTEMSPRPCVDDMALFVCRGVVTFHVVVGGK